MKIPLVRGDAGTTHVKPGENVQWTATELSHVKPPAIFAGSHCTGTIVVPADGTPAPAHACHVTGQPGSYGYTSGLGASEAYSERLVAGNDTIIVDPGEPNT